MENKNVKEISTNAYQVVLGVLLCLVSIVLCMNAGYIAKGVSFSFSYALGMASYIFYAFLFVEGISLIFAKKSLPIKPSIYFWFSIILGIGVIGLLTYFSVDQSSAYLSFVNGEGQVSIITKINNVFGNISYGDKVGNYFRKESVIIFFGENEFGCGLLGYALLALGNSAFSSTIGGLALSIAFMVFGVIGIVCPIILNTRKNVKTIVAKPVETADINSKKRIKNINVVRGAKNVDPKTYHSEVSGAGKNVEPSLSEINSYDNGVSSTAVTAFNNDFLDDSTNDIRPEVESVDSLEEAVFDTTGLGISVSSKAETNIPAIQPIQNLTNDENVFEPAQNEIIPEEKSVVNTFDEHARVDRIAPVSSPKVETPVAQPQFQPAQNIIQSTPVAPVNPIPSVIEEPKQEVPKKKVRVNFSVMGSELLKQYDTTSTATRNATVAAERREIINNTFKDFGIGAEAVDYTIGPSVTRFNIRYNANVSSRSVNNIVQDISIRLNGVNARFEQVVEGQSTSGLEIPNEEITMVPFKDVYEALPDAKKHPLGVAFGKNIKGQVICSDFNEFPHILVSGTTGSGKSVFVNSLICTLIMRNSPDDLKLVLVDPKKVEMSRYADMPHLLTPIITEASKVKVCLDKLVEEMEERYSLFSKNNATNIKEYNEDCEENGNEKMPYIIAILDEYADLIDDCKEISLPVVSLSQKARACGIHLMVATQRPSTNVVTGVIKANMPTHVALMTANYTDSITIIGEGGAEKLLGKGDMLVQSPLVSRVGVCRLQSCYIDRKEIGAIVNDLKSKYPTEYDPKFLDLEEKKVVDFNPNEAGPEETGGGNDEEAKYRSIKEWVMAQEYMSMSRIQRECAVGFNRAGRFFQRLQKEGIVGTETEGNRGCKVLIQDKFGAEFDDSAIATSEDNSYIK